MLVLVLVLVLVRVRIRGRARCRRRRGALHPCLMLRVLERLHAAAGEVAQAGEPELLALPALQRLALLVPAVVPPPLPLGLLLGLRLLLRLCPAGSAGSAGLVGRLASGPVQRGPAGAAPAFADLREPRQRGRGRPERLGEVGAGVRAAAAAAAALHGPAGADYLVLVLGVRHVAHATRAAVVRAIVKDALLVRFLGCLQQ